MGQSANIFDITALRPPLPIRTGPRASVPPSARLIPGAANLAFVARKKNSQSVLGDGSWASTPQPLPSLPARVVHRLLPEFLHRFHPSWLGVALMDAAMISMAFFLQTAILGPLVFQLVLPSGFVPPLPEAAFFLFFAAFFFFAIQEGLYSNCFRSLREECAVVGKAVVWTTPFASLSLLFSSSRTSWLPLLLLSSASGAALCAARALFAAVLGPRGDGELHNVLIVGSRAVAPRILSAIERDSRYGSSVKGLVEEQHLCGPDGPDTLRTIAREECIDEVIIATPNPHVAEAAIREAHRNHLDVRLMPAFFGSPTQALEMESLTGVPLIRVHEEVLPSWPLAVKRLVDVVLATAALLALTPLLLLIAIVIKLDSSGLVLYRAVRVGRKKQRFTCYKFRTMIPEADAGREGLRCRNERDGAFFKITNDPRTTRAGRLLRRYSLDELPQLWNVLRGEMSLVGPRPHPPDDVERYRVEHMQRLDFLPGITGLWQVTARGESSFEASVRLDVEYIKTWNLALDLRILYQTIPAVFHGSGA
jgi:exopolysaccharide biosynthesis polyprenyl glycosylphosphotransferase